MGMDIKTQTACVKIVITTVVTDCGSAEWINIDASITHIYFFRLLHLLLRFCFYLAHFTTW